MNYAATQSQGGLPPNATIGAGNSAFGGGKYCFACLIFLVLGFRI